MEVWNEICIYIFFLYNATRQKTHKTKMKCSNWNFIIWNRISRWYKCGFEFRPLSFSLLILPKCTYAWISMKQITSHFFVLWQNTPLNSLSLNPFHKTQGQNFKREVSCWNVPCLILTALSYLHHARTISTWNIY